MSTRTPLDRLTHLAVLRDDTAAAIDAEIDRLHRLGVNYGKMATALGVSRQAVRQRHVRHAAKQEARSA